LWKFLFSYIILFLQSAWFFAANVHFLLRWKRKRSVNSVIAVNVWILHPLWKNSPCIAKTYSFALSIADKLPVLRHIICVCTDIRLGTVCLQDSNCTWDCAMLTPVYVLPLYANSTSGCQFKSWWDVETAYMPFS
jgi:hypothetical protein